MTSPSEIGREAAAFRITHFLNISLAALAGKDGALKQACDAAEKAFADVITRLEAEVAANGNLAVANGNRAKEEAVRAEAAEARLTQAEELLRPFVRMADEFEKVFRGEPANRRIDIDAMNAARAFLAEKEKADD